MASEEVTKTARGPKKRTSRTKGKYKSPKMSAAMTALWASPEGRARMKIRDASIAASRKLNPEKFKRTGIPTGMTRATVAPLWARANELADRFIKIMKDVGELPADETVLLTNELGEEITLAVPNTDDGKAEAALREAFVLAVGPTDQKIKIQAINTVLNFTKSKPESKTKLTLNKAEDFLDAVSRDLGGAD